MSMHVTVVLPPQPRVVQSASVWRVAVGHAQCVIWENVTRSPTELLAPFGDACSPPWPPSRSSR